MKISVVTVCLNNAETIGQTIASVAEQDFSDIEHIIVDGGSTDGTINIIESHRGCISHFICEPDNGIYDAMNKGIAAATGEVVGFLNADDVYNGDWVVTAIADVLSDPGIDACYANLVYVKRDNLQKVVRFWRSRSYQDGLVEKGWMPAHPTFYARRKIYEAHGMYDTQYQFHSDDELTARLFAVHGIRTRYIPETWVRMRMGGTTNRSISNIIRGNAESYKAMKALGLKVTPFYFATKFAMRIPQYFRR